MTEDTLVKLRPLSEEEREIKAGKWIANPNLFSPNPESQVTIRKYSRFFPCPQHTLREVEAVYMCSGSTVHFVNNREIVLRAGDLLFMGTGADHRMRAPGEDDIAVHFTILPEFFEKTIPSEGTPLSDFLGSCLRNPETPTSFLYFAAGDLPEVQNLCENLVRSLLTPAPNRRSINQYTMGVLLLNLLNCTDRMRYQTREEYHMVFILRYVENNYVDGTLKELSQLLQYDPSWLSREIKKWTGKRFMELLQQKRLSQAAFLLRTTDMHIDDVALSVGYENMSYFYRLFRGVYGESPRAYRCEHTDPSSH